MTLLAYLALEGPKERSFVADLFWLGSPDPLNRLSTTLSRLRDVAEGLFHADDQRVWTDLETDAHVLLAAAERGDHDAVVEAYAGPFLGRLSVQGSVELQEWIHAKREFLAGLVRASLIAIAQRDVAAGRYYVAAKAAERGFRLEGAAPPSSRELATMYTVLLAGDNIYAKEVRGDAAELGVSLPSSPAEARAQLNSLAEARAERAERRLAPDVPTASGPLVGRELEVQRVLELLADPECRLLSIMGPGGIGKTRLALEVASRAGSVFEDGVCFVPLVTVDEPARMADAIAGRLGISLSDSDPEAQLIRGLAARSLLLVLDNLEHLLGGVDLVARIVDSAPSVKVLATSRERLRLRAEWAFPLSGLAYPPAGPEDALDHEHQNYGAVELFVQSARRVRRGFRLDAASQRPVMRICRAVGGMPLALELAAGWLDTLPLADVAVEVEREIDLLETTASDVQERHQSMRVVFESSWTRLSEEERSIVARLSIFAGSFGRESAAAVAGADLRSLRSLVSKSFVALEDDRHVMHELLRQLAAKALQSDAQQRVITEERYANHFLERLEHELPNFKGPEQRAVLARIARDLPNIERAWRSALERSDWSRISRTVTALSVFFHHTNRDGEGAEAFELAFDRLDRAGPELTEEARIAILAAFASFQIAVHGRVRDAEAATRSAIERYERMDPRPDIDPMCHPYYAGWKSAALRGEAKTALAYSERLRDALLPSYPIRAAFSAGAFTALSYAHLGELDLAQRLFEEAYAVTLAAGEDLHAENLTALLGGIALERGELEVAERYLEACLRMAEKHGVHRKKVEAWYGLARVALERGDLDEAELRIQKALRVSSRLGIVRTEAALNAYSAQISLRRGDRSKARALLGKALDMVWVGRPSHNLGIVLTNIALYLEAVGDEHSALRILRWIAAHPSTAARDRKIARERLSGESIEAGGAEPTEDLIRDLHGLLGLTHGRDGVTPRTASPNAREIDTAS